ncbi:PXA domain protein 1 [Sphaceloma murrayae]|uniref:PXA domain protein 1 n=1 Tax=Sphaceloma murrayae TaxID=2082308 RepID=A0A2K1QSA7_9PEZI|nr:PXA domain protein 1 [Sphaceloma murrayae]
MSALGVRARPAHLRQKSSSRAAPRAAERRSEATTRSNRDAARKSSENDKNDATTAAFVRRVLCASQLKPGAETTITQSLDELLPPLTSSNEVDLQLYGIIAVIVRLFVQIWYSKITPDHEFVDEIVQIIAHCTRAFEQRLRRVDLEAILLDELPELLNQHADGRSMMWKCFNESPITESIHSILRWTPLFTDIATEQLIKSIVYRISVAASSGDQARSLGSDVRRIYHSMQPHPALSPIPSESDPESADTQKLNEAAWRHLLIEGVLELLLPPEDLQNPCLKVLVNEIFSELIIGNVLAGRISEGWFLWEGITKAIQAARPEEAAGPQNLISKQGARLEQFGLLPTGDSAMAPDRARRRTSSIYAMIINIGWEILRVVLLLYGVLRAAFIALSDAVYLPERRGDQHTSSVHPSPSSSFANQDPRTTFSGSDVAQDPTTKPGPTAIIEMSAWRLPVAILGLNTSMPWLTGALSLLQHHAVHGFGKIGGVNARLDRLLSHMIATHVLAPSRLPTLLRTVRVNLFPNNALGPGKPPPGSAEEVATIKRTCAKEIRGLIPENIRKIYFGKATSDLAQEEWELKRIGEDILSVFEDGYCNKHLLFAIVEVVLCRIFPELMERKTE